MVSPNDVRRLFLQAVFSRAIISDKLAKTIWLKSIEAVQGNYTVTAKYLTLFKSLKSRQRWSKYPPFRDSGRMGRVCEVGKRLFERS